MKNILRFIFAFLVVTSIQAQTEIFDTLLKANVNAKGNVNYKGLKSSEVKLDSYLSYLEKTSPEKSWSATKIKAFWVNAYNAYTIKIILENYPLKSITKIKKKGKDAWNIPFAKVGKKTYTLNDIEHKILRKNYNDPKIHVAVNCASNSCPQLGNFAFTEANYEAKTDELMRKFINDPKRNKITKKGMIHISEIFNWFKKDFTKKGSVIDYINKYANQKIDSNAKIHYLPYDWNLNEK